MGVGQEHRLHGGGIDRQGNIFKNIRTLLHAAVHQIVPASHLQQRAAAGDLMGRADELDFHSFDLLRRSDGWGVYVSRTK